MAVDINVLRPSILILQNCIAHLMEAGISQEQAINRAFDLALELVQFNAKGLPEMATPEYANVWLQAALLLETATTTVLMK